MRRLPKVIRGGITLGILVSGAEKVEHEMEQLWRNLKTLREEKNAPRMENDWNGVESSLERARGNLRQLSIRVRPFRNELENQTKAFLHRTDIRARMMLLSVVDGSISELQKVRQRLDQSLHGIRPN